MRTSTVITSALTSPPATEPQAAVGNRPLIALRDRRKILKPFQSGHYA